MHAGREFFQYVIGSILRLCLKIFWIFPIKKNRIFFTSYKGTQYSCNPKYIYEYLKEEPGLELIWGFRRQALKKAPASVKKVNLLSAKGLYACMTAGIIIDNIGFFPYIPYRRKQFAISTWHGGGAYKRVDHVTLNKTRFKILLDQRKAEATDLFILSSEKSKLVADSLLLGRKIPLARIGMPRNDLLFDKKRVETAARRVRDLLGIQDSERVVLYAPTYRGEEAGKDSFAFDLDAARLLRVLHEKTGERYRFLVRAHHYLIGRMRMDFSGILDASQYPDSMELLCAADMLITDYSSIMWDYSILERPCVLYIPDVQQYRGFYVDIEKWHFPLAYNMDELCSIVQNISEEEWREHARCHLKEFGSYETGQACRQTAEIIRRQIGERS